MRRRHHRGEKKSKTFESTYPMKTHFAVVVKGGAQEMSARLRISLSPPPSHRHQKRLTGEYRTPLTCCRNLGPRIHPRRFASAMVLENHIRVVTCSEAGWIVLDKDFGNPTRTLG